MVRILGKQVRVREAGRRACGTVFAGGVGVGRRDVPLCFAVEGAFDACDLEIAL
jgi:hypothetical protein